MEDYSLSALGLNGKNSNSTCSVTHFRPTGSEFGYKEIKRGNFTCFERQMIMKRMKLYNLVGILAINCLSNSVFYQALREMKEASCVYLIDIFTQALNIRDENYTVHKFLSLIIFL
ncbi:hypothetical protein EGR_00387 [Echinococcus granulosus]|uniref:Uncharacterized protein n=1 Tax=Echinococcus granulosus TaxID=6210 RepID=W6UUY7_ECHGR|nr:hypothetical protein EGR_00387 [Echinococcus granulosus]EUB65118.1 hypothetical protein EGR_00387 [Echinococcus granulosus]